MKVNFPDYLNSTRQIAKEEKEILDILSSREVLTPIELRAAKSSLQVLIENAIGKSKRILKHYDCQIIPQSGKDAISFLYDSGAIDEETYQQLSAAIGFRNSMIHDYMKFNKEVLIKIVKDKTYLNIYDFLMDDINYKNVVIKRIENLNF